MRVLEDNEQGEVNVVGVILLVVLVIGVALVLTSILMGTTSALHSSVYIASEAKADEIPQASGFPVQGPEPFYPGGPAISFCRAVSAHPGKRGPSQSYQSRRKDPLPPAFPSGRVS